MIKRLLENIITEKLHSGKGILIIGPRQTGKTTLLKKFYNQYLDKALFLNCDEPDIRSMLTDSTSTRLSHLIGNKEYVFIDEAQRVRNIGLTLKLMIDSAQGVKIIATGSSALELSNSINEPLTGRKLEYFLLPFSFEELAGHYSALEEDRLLERRLIFGMYPDVVQSPGNEKEILQNLAGSYLYKDVLSFQDVRRPEVLEKLLQALSLQVGSEVYYHEIGQTIGADPETVMRYIDLLEKSYIIFRLPSLSRNVRNEIKKSRKIYFYDNGIRNAILSSYKNFDQRSDKSALWENWLISERWKYLSYRGLFVNRFFWRTAQKQEIDYIEERDGILYAWEFAYSPQKKKRIPKTFINAYTGAVCSIIHRDNYRDFLSDKI